MLIPPNLSQAVGIEECGDVQLRREADEIRLIPGKVVVRRVQKTEAGYVPEGVSLVDELIAERRCSKRKAE